MRVKGPGLEARGVLVKSSVFPGTTHFRFNLQRTCITFLLLYLEFSVCDLLYFYFLLLLFIYLQCLGLEYARKCFSAELHPQPHLFFFFFFPLWQYWG
jgi:hypothetical protein